MRRVHETCGLSAGRGDAHHIRLGALSAARTHDTRLGCTGLGLFQRRAVSSLLTAYPGQRPLDRGRRRRACNNCTKKRWVTLRYAHPTRGLRDPWGRASRRRRFVGARPGAWGRERCPVETRGGSGTNCPWERIRTSRRPARRSAVPRSKSRRACGRVQ